MGLTMRVRKAVLSFVSLSIFSFSMAADKLEVLKAVCPAKIVKAKTGGYMCPVCPSFTSNAGNEDDFFVNQVLEGEFIKGMRLVFVSYNGCEPHVKDFGGVFFLYKDANGNTNVYTPNIPSLDGCRVSRKNDKDIIICETGSTFQGVTVNTKLSCEFNQKNEFHCSGRSCEGKSCRNIKF